jgi:hypothetical protein
MKNGLNLVGGKMDNNTVVVFVLSLFNYLYPVLKCIVGFLKIYRQKIIFILMVFVSEAERYKCKHKLVLVIEETRIEWNQRVIQQEEDFVN